MSTTTSSLLKRRAALAAGLFAASMASATVGISLISATEWAAPVWAANGFAAAALLLLPQAWGLSVLAACFLGQICVGFGYGVGSPAFIALTLVNVGETLMVAWLARLTCGGAVRLTSLERVVRLLVLAVVPAAIASAVAATLIEAVFLNRPPVTTFVSWFVSDGLGLALVLPAVMLARRTKHDFHRPLWEHLLIYAVISAIAAAAFTVKGVPLHFLLFPAALLAAFRLGPRGAGFAMLLLTVETVSFIMFSASHGLSPDWSMAQRMRAGQLMIGTIFLTSLVTAMAVADQSRLKRLWVNRSALARRAQTRAQAAGRAKAEFLATMSHEIRTPMNSILGFTEVLLRREDLPEEARRQLGLVDQAGASLLTVVNDILDFSKMEAGEIDLQPRPCSPRTLAQDSAAIIAEAARAKGLAVEVETSGDVDGLVLIDDLRVRQILLNLLTNAVKFTPAGEIRLSLEVRDAGGLMRALRFTVADTGVGVEPDKLDRLFRRFSQADGSVSRAYGGTGLGLAICKGLTEQMGGRIGVASRPGLGSQFWFEIPAPVAEAAPDEVIPAEAPAQGGVRVLLVDDHPMNRELGATLLAILECDVTLAESGEEAIAAMQRETFDVVLMDLHMPHMDGWEACRRIVALGGDAARTPIIALSADVMPDTAEQCLRAGMVDVAAKPIKIEVLHEVLSRWAGRGADGALRAA